MWVQEKGWGPLLPFPSNLALRLPLGKQATSGSHPPHSYAVKHCSEQAWQRALGLPAPTSLTLGAGALLQILQADSPGLGLSPLQRARGRRVHTGTASQGGKRLSSSLCTAPRAWVSPGRRGRPLPPPAGAGALRFFPGEQAWRMESSTALPTENGLGRAWRSSCLKVLSKTREMLVSSNRGGSVAPRY